MVALAGPDPLLADRLCQAAREMGIDPGKLANPVGGRVPALPPAAESPPGIPPPAEGPAPMGPAPMGPASAIADSPPQKKRPASRSWAMLMARIYETLPLVCPRCQAAMRIVAFITASATIKHILEHIGEPGAPPAIAPARPPPEEASQAELAFA